MKDDMQPKRSAEHEPQRWKVVAQAPEGIKQSDRVGGLARLHQFVEKERELIDDNDGFPGCGSLYQVFAGALKQGKPRVDLRDHKITGLLALDRQE